MKAIIKLKKWERGAFLIESLVGLAIMGAVAGVFLSALATGAKATIIGNEQTLAESLARSQLEYVQNVQKCLWDPTPPYEYATDPALLVNVPPGWSVPPAQAFMVAGTNDNIQNVTVNVSHNGRQILSLSTYKSKQP